MVVITNMGTAPATRSSYNGKEMKRVWLLNIEILCQKGCLSPISVKPKCKREDVSDEIGSIFRLEDRSNYSFIE